MRARGGLHVALQIVEAANMRLTEVDVRELLVARVQLEGQLGQVTLDRRHFCEADLLEVNLMLREKLEGLAHDLRAEAAVILREYQHLAGSQSFINVIPHHLLVGLPYVYLTFYTII